MEWLGGHDGTKTKAATQAAQTFCRETHIFNADMGWFDGSSFLGGLSLYFVALVPGDRRKRGLAKRWVGVYCKQMAYCGYGYSL